MITIIQGFRPLRQMVFANLVSMYCQPFSTTNQQDKNAQDKQKAAVTSTSAKPASAQTQNTPEPKREIYIHRINYNFEQFKNYSIKQKQILAELKQKEEIQAKAQPIDLLPRRKRRVYDKPLYDLDLTNYSAWRVFDKKLSKLHKDGLPVVCKIPIAPRLLKKVFGVGINAYRNYGRSTFEYDFEDVDMNLYILYDFKATTSYWGKNIPNYDYEVLPRKRKQKWPEVEDFWNSDQPHQFRVNCTQHADFRKFKQWILEQIEKNKDGKSWDEKLEEKYGKLETYDVFEKKYQLTGEPSVFKYDKSFWVQKGQKLDKKKVEQNLYYKKIQPAKTLPEEYKIKNEAQK